MGVVFTAVSPNKQNFPEATTDSCDTTVGTEIDTKCSASYTTGASELLQSVHSCDVRTDSTAELNLNQNNTCRLFHQPAWLINCLDELLSNEAAELVAGRLKHSSH